MQYGKFTDSGKAYCINTPFTPTPWINRLFNDEFVLEIDQRLQGGGALVNPLNYSREAFNYPENKFYLNIDGVPYQLCKGQGNSFECEHRLYQSQIIETFGAVSVSIRVFVPSKGQKSFWTVKIENHGESKVELSSFCVFPFFRREDMAFETEMEPNRQLLYYTGFPYYIKYDEKEEMEEKIRFRYILCDTPAYSWEGNPRRFFGCADTSIIPNAVRDNCCANGKGEYIDNCIGALQHKFTLAPGGSESINLILGIEKSKEDMYKATENFPNVDAELDEVCQVWQKWCDAFWVSTPDENFNAFTNYWLKQQMVYFSRHNRGSAHTCLRNQLQDYIGHAYIEPEDAFARAVKVLERQHFNGYYKSHYNTDGGPEQALQRNRFSDTYIWIVLCFVEIIENIGKKELYQFPVGYMDSPLKEPIIVHLRKAAHYMSNQLCEHGLCLLLDGDWNDPINGPGRKGKGESTWNTMAFCYAIELLNKVDFDPYLDKVRKKLIDAVNTYCWDGKWYLAGIDDDGKPYGSQKDSSVQLYLNAQTWAIISGIATGDRLEKTVSAIESLQVPFGYLLLNKPFDEYDPVWGKISLKQKGTAENGSVYNHSVMFKALADCIRGAGNLAWETMQRINPSNPEHSPAESGQIPTYYTNYCVGRRNENFGLSSCSYSTGTTAWHIFVTLRYMFGFQTNSDGNITIHPAIPKVLENASMERVFCGKRYRLSFNDGTPNLLQLDM